MIYLDYSATTKIDKEVQDTYIKVCNDFFANPNSLHKLGTNAKDLIDASTRQIAKILDVKPDEIIYTSGATEANNLAIKGVALRNQKKGKHIITTNLEHSSVYGPMDFLKKNGFEIDYVNTIDGLIDLDDLKNKLRDDTILVSICAVNSEIGIKQDIEKIAKMLKKYKNCYFHVDATQAIGKTKIDYKDVDLLSCTAHKFFGPKGIGVLIKKENVLMDSLILGGKSTTIYRSGTPVTPLIASFSKALRLITENEEQNYKKIKDLNNMICEHLKEYKNISINTNQYCIPHILNISVLNAKPESIQHALEEYDIYISTQSACAKTNKSRSVYDFTKDDKEASHSIRISISKYTTEEEIKYFLECFDKVLKKFNSLI